MGLCLLIQFPDVAGTILPQEVNDFCNKVGYTGYGNNGSVLDYFSDNSKGSLKYTNRVTSYYTTQHPRAYYTNPMVSYGTRARELIKEALSELKTKGFDFTGLSVDDGGYIYALNVFYAGVCPNNWSEGLWPHSSSLATPFALEPGKWVYDYQITDIGSELALGTFCHENGHMVCDFPDLYDYGYESKGTGVYCLMAAGGIPDEKNPTQICAYLKYKCGWAKKVTTMASGLEAAISADENEFFLYPKNQVEYFIIENRYRAGRDEGLPASGLAIWHVDELGSNNYEQMTESQHYECALEQADNRFDLEHGTNYGDMGDLFSAATNPRLADSTSPSSKWWDGSLSGLEIRDISQAGQRMTFRSGPSGGENKAKTFRATSVPAKDIPDNDQAGIQDVIRFSEAAVVSSIKVSVDITHTYQGDLRVMLDAPSGASVVLHDRKGGRTHDLKVIFDVTSTPALRNVLGQSVQGEWTLTVQDLAPADNGRLNRWDLEVEGKADTTIDLEDSPGADIPDDDPNGIERTLGTNAPGQVKGLSVSVDITHTFIGDLVVTLISPAGTSVDLHQRTGGSADNIIKTYTVETTPDLEALLGKPIQGNWRLKVADLAGRDVGKLNRWSLKIVPEL